MSVWAASIIAVARVTARWAACLCVAQVPRHDISQSGFSPVQGTHERANSCGVGLVCHRCYSRRLLLPWRAQASAAASSVASQALQEFRGLLWRLVRERGIGQLAAGIKEWAGVLRVSKSVV